MPKINTRSNKFYLDAKNGGFYVNKDATPTFSAEGYSRLWCVTEKSSGNITGITQSDTGYYAVKWWDDTINFFENGDTFSKTAAGTKAFEVYPAIRESTSLLLNFNGSNESTVFSETSGNNLIVNAGGNASISTNQSKFGGSSVYFDGSGDYLSVSSSEYLNLTGLVPYTIEFWMYIESYSYSYTTVLTRRVGVNWQYLIGFSEPSTTELFFSATSQGPGVSPGYSQCRSGFSLPIQQWHHVAATVSNGFANFFINGILVDAKPWAFQPDNSADLWLAQQGSGGEFFNGYIDDLRIVKGKAIYGDFDPPTSAHPSSSLTDPYWSNVSLLLHMDGTDGSTVFTDSSSNTLTVTANGNAQIDTGKWKFGGASGRFDGNGDYLRAEVEFDYANDFTIEFWFIRLGIGEGQVHTIFEAGDIQSGQGGVHIYVDNNGVFSANDGYSAAIEGGSSPIGTWQHVALTRENGVNILFVDGASVGTSSQNFSTVLINDIISIGGAPMYGFYAHCNVDDFRMTEGIARYTSNFTPPTAPLSPITTQIVPYGQFDGFNISGNDLTQVRAENVSLMTSGGALIGGYLGYWGNWWWGPYFSPILAEQGNLSNNNLSSSALDQFYSDLSNGTGDLYVQGNPGIVSDDPTIATAKGYTVFGSVPPSTSLLLNFDGDFTDSSPNQQTISAIGGATTSNSQSKFGGYSGYFPSSGHLEIEDSENFNLSGVDFTIESWFFPISLPPDMYQSSVAIVSKDTYGINFSWNINLAQNGIVFVTNQANTIVWAPTTISTLTWNHFAITSTNGVLRIFLNGIVIHTEQITVTNSPSKITVGCNSWNNPTQFINGYLDDLRVINRMSIYTSNFSPPSGPLGVYP